jgi:hypothetical protein
MRLILCEITSRRLKALAHALLAAGPLLNPPFNPAFDPNTSAMLASVRAATPGSFWEVFATDIKGKEYYMTETVFCHYQL